MYESEMSSFDYSVRSLKQTFVLKSSLNNGQALEFLCVKIIGYLKMP